MDLDEEITAYFDGKLSTEAFAALEKRLLDDEDAQAAFSKRAKLESALRDLFVEGSTPKTPQITNKPMWLWIGATTIAIFVIGIGWITRFLVPQALEEDQASASPTLGVAVISAEADAVWKPSVKQGSILPPGRYTLESGLAQIDFFGGATLSIAAPAEIELMNGEEAVLHAGKVRVNVPPAARGFEIRAHDVMIEDLGTSFGLNVSETGNSGLIVFDGEVRTHGRDAKTQLLKTGDAISFREGKAIATNKPEPTDFPDLPDILSKSGTQIDGRYALWKAASETRKHDPRLIAYFDFEALDQATRRLANRAVRGNGSELDGGIVGARVAEGRWPGKTALDFRREGDRVRFVIPGEFDELTIFAWVRIDALDRQMNSLFLTDFYDPNEFHWQLSRKGALHFATSPHGVEDLPRNNRRFYSEEFWNPQMSGRWFFLASTVNTKENRVTHYVNGQPVGFSGGTNMEKPLRKLRIGKADLGNWTDPIWAQAIRTLNGRIDEFAIYRAELAPDEIAEIFAHEKP